MSDTSEFNGDHRPNKVSSNQVENYNEKIPIIKDDDSIENKNSSSIENYSSDGSEIVTEVTCNSVESLLSSSFNNKSQISNNDNTDHLSQETGISMIDTITTLENSGHEVSKPAAVVVQSARKSYGSGKQRVIALDDLQMRVPYGAIYGLLGASGCGKTTLLNCLVNQLKLESGKIYLFGFEPGSSAAAVPGERVGYMPQELALYQDFTIAETFNYFGKLVGLQRLTLDERTEYLIKFLDLPNSERRINALSGGQQRRVSLAAAILHEPELLILDEPTVGVDPKLRANIWNYMTQVSKCNKTTIVITTHYIEEARQADKIGLMRHGRLLAESTPQNLLDYYKINSLESVFLKLCNEDDTTSALNNIDDQAKSIPKRLSSQDFMHIPKTKKPIVGIRRVGNGSTSMLRDEEDKSILMQPWTGSEEHRHKFSMRRSTALMIKNSIRLRRNLFFLSFSFILPPMQTILFCVTIGGLPHDLPMAVVDLDQHASIIPLPDVSNMYLSNINEHIITQKDYANFDLGHESVELGKCWGLIFFNSSFSRDFLNLLPSKNGDATIHVYMDDTDQLLSDTIKITLYKALEKTIGQLIPTIPHFNYSDYYDLPLKFEDPVYANDNSSFRNFVAPGIILTIIFFMAVGLTSLSFIIEKREGLLNRSWVAGVRPVEVIFAHLTTQTCILIIQITLILAFMFPVFDIPCKGSIFLVILMSLLQGFCGMSFGFMVSSLAADELTAVQIILGAFYPILLISGIVWPVEGMPTFLRYISYILPQTYACEGLRAIMYRGWGIDHFVVWIGFIITIIWTCFFLCGSILAIRIKK